MFPPLQRVSAKVDIILPHSGDYCRIISTVRVCKVLSQIAIVGKVERSETQQKSEKSA